MIKSCFGEEKNKREVGVNFFLNLTKGKLNLSKSILYLIVVFNNLVLLLESSKLISMKNEEAN